MKRLEEVRGTVPRVRVAYRLLLCMHCDEAPCIPACPSNAIYKRDDGIIIINPEKCAGCAHLLDNDWSKPRCVDACPTEATKLGEESEFPDFIARAEIVNPELGLKPRVHYLNIMKRLFAGTVYDARHKEVVIGAICTLTKTRSREKRTVSTDSFNDFWFKGLPDNVSYELQIEKDSIVKAFEDINAENDVNLGDIPLT